MWGNSYWANSYWGNSYWGGTLVVYIIGEVPPDRIYIIFFEERTYFENLENRNYKTDLESRTYVVGGDDERERIC